MTPVPPLSAPLSRRTVLATALGGLVGSSLLTGCLPNSTTRDISRDVTRDMVRSDADRTAPGSAPATDVVAALTRFAGEFTAAAQAGQASNYLCSPLSLWLALAMTRNGAAGQTASEMDKALLFGDVGQLNQALNTATQLLERRNGKKGGSARHGEVIVNIANQLFGDKTLSKEKDVWGKDFLTALARYYGTGMAMADFRGNPDGERRRINRWVAGQTHDKIKDLLPGPAVNARTRLMLVNAVYLAAPWIEKFSSVGKQRFTGSDGVVQADMMHISLQSVGKRTPLATVARIPYLGDELAMTVILPAPGKEDAFRDRLAAELPTILGPLKSAELTLTMPKFSYQTKTDVTPTLQSRGMNLAFTDRADFSAMCSRPLYVSDIAHQCTIGVDEEGTEASAATAVVMGATSGRASEYVLDVTLDRPFWYVIHDVATRVPLFIGYLANPKES